ncbi:pyrroloquinoline quinone biosynthesis protein PqqB [Rhizobium sp. EC-SD404]|uniref:pyrroloquinoline quinone biosynthesis protein PqqB n=1 Tax=Rhizobium sp. EC-SD404 TaxID=2038389 RepID=UPI00125BAB07|nr:pyrroloquinoline quinone biosynthesis protein PqqB [Rhizobium sp. EC-SD404]VVT02736.1 Coenzyme PQQ synthesis protein B [Rhizobium sp. EC-SD404]
MQETNNVRALVLGAAAGGGLPQWNCGCSNCREARDPNGALTPQTQSSLAVTANGRDWSLLNASPDIRSQIEANPALHPRSLRDTPIASVLVTNGDIDHIAGLLILREKQPFRLFTTAAIGDILAANPVFEVLDPNCVERITIALDQPFALVDGMEATLFAVPGKLPLFMEGENPDTALEGEQTVGVELTASGKRIYYIPGCGRLTDRLAARIRGADLVFFDGTVFHDDEMARAGTGLKTGRRMGHMPMSGEGGSIEALKDLAIGRTIYVHINNTNPVWQHGPERRAAEQAGHEIGHDGMEVQLT